MKKISKGFGVGKQYLKEKMGKAESSVDEDPELKAALERLAKTSEAFTALTKATKSIFDAHPETLNEARLFLDKEVKFAKKMSREYKIARLDVDNRANELKSVQAKNLTEKVPVAQAKLDEAKANLDQTLQNLFQALKYVEQTQDGIHKETVDAAVDLLRAYPLPSTVTGGERLPDSAGASVVTTAVASSGETTQTLESGTQEEGEGLNGESEVGAEPGE